MEAIVLAGGRGTRLQATVKDRPKPLALVGGSPFLSYIFDYLVEQGITHIILSVGYKKEQIISFYENEYKGVPISYAIEKEPLQTGGAIKNSFRLLNQEGPVFVLNGDTYCPFNFKKALEVFQSTKADVVLPVKFLEDTSRYGTVKFDIKNRINSFIEKRKGEGYINTGCYLLSHQVFSAFTEDKFSFEKDFLEKKCTEYNFRAIEVDDFFIDIGIPEDYFRACSIFMNK